MSERDKQVAVKVYGDTEKTDHEWIDELKKKFNFQINPGHIPVQGLVSTPVGKSLDLSIEGKEKEETKEGEEEPTKKQTKK